MVEQEVRPLTMLIVDDEPGVGYVLERYLERLFPIADVLYVESASAALEILNTRPVHLVLTDLQMPEMTGTALSATIKSRWPEIPVLLMSASAPSELAQAATAGHADGTLAKPFNRTELEQVVRAVLELP
jgi:two-component system response regulator AtoC